MYTSRSQNSWSLSLTVLHKSDIPSNSHWTNSTFQLQSSKLPPLFSTISIMPKLFDIWSSKHAKCLYSLCYKCSCKWLHSSIWAVTVESVQSLEYYSCWFPESTISDLSSAWIYCGRCMWIGTRLYFIHTVLQCCSNRSLQKWINHWVVTLVADKLRRQWLSVYVGIRANCISNLSPNHTLQLTTWTCVRESLYKYTSKTWCL